MKRYIVAVVAMALFMAALVTISPLSGAQTVTIQNQKTGLRKPSPSPTPTPSSKTATWTGNGAYYDGGDFTLTDSRCEESNGEPYLYWVLTAGGKDSINSAAITIDGSGPYAMTRQRNGSFKYTQTFESIDSSVDSATSFVVPTTVTASYTRAKSATLVISHGCTGETQPRADFTFSLGDGVEDGFYEVIGTDCDTNDQLLGNIFEYEGQSFDVCTNESVVWNVKVVVPENYTVTSSPEGICNYFPGDDELTAGRPDAPSGGSSGGYWLCTVTEEETVITITLAPSDSPSFSLAGELDLEAFYDFNPADCGGFGNNSNNLNDTLNEVCDSDSNPNVQIDIPDDYTITASPEANCQSAPSDGGYLLWSCTVTEPNTVITITELPSFLLSVGGGVGGTISFIPSDCDTTSLASGLLSDFPFLNTVCATPPAEVFNGTNVEIITDAGVTVTSSPAANCVAQDTQRWLCTVTQPNTAITLVAPDDIGIQPPSTATSTEVRSVKR